MCYLNWIPKSVGQLLLVISLVCFISACVSNGSKQGSFAKANLKSVALITDLDNSICIKYIGFTAFHNKHHYEENAFDHNQLIVEELTKGFTRHNVDLVDITANVSTVSFNDYVKYFDIGDEPYLAEAYKLSILDAAKGHDYVMIMENNKKHNNGNCYASTYLTSGIGYEYRKGARMYVPPVSIFEVSSGNFINNMYFSVNEGFPLVKELSMWRESWFNRFMNRYRYNISREIDYYFVQEAK